MKRKQIVICIWIVVALIGIISITGMVTAGDNSKTLYSMLRLNFSESEVHYYMSLPQIQNELINKDSVMFDVSSILISRDFKKVYYFHIDPEKCKIKVKKLIDNNRKKPKR